MMSRIAFIAPYKEIYLAGRKVIGDIGIGAITESYLCRNDRAVPLARKLESDGVDVIVTRGGTAALIAQAGVEVPVVEISIGGPELVRALVEAKKLTGKDRPTVAVLAFANMIYHLEVLSDILDVQLEIYELSSTASIADVVDKLAADSRVDLVLSGVSGTRLARRKGLETLWLGSDETSLRDAFLEAEKVAYARQLEKKRHQTLRVLVDYSVEGIISVNGEGLIEVFNPAAERLLGLAADTVLGKKLSDVFPMFAAADCLRGGPSQVGRMVSVGSVTVLANIAPIKVADDLVGTMITFQDITKIAEMEVKIRKELYTKGLVADYHFADILGSSTEISRVKETAGEFAKSDATVLISGASGTGKELFAQSIHNSSKRSRGPFVAINCAAIPPSLLESELFGYVEGAFTGANRKGKPGLFELAHTGTIFLDEISEMDQYGQSRLLRVLQERQVMRLGDDRYIPVDARIVVATNRNLGQLVQEGLFRQDLYYRLNVLSLHLPPLKERPQDVLLLVGDFIRRFREQYYGDSRQPVIEPAARELLLRHSWPGNVRELKNFCERLVVRDRGGSVTAATVRTLLMPDDAGSPPGPAGSPLNAFSEKDRLIKAMAEAGFNQGKAAELLGINRSTLYRKLKKYAIGIKKYCND
jgi:PAS domain S-box-containing protein